MKILHRPVIQLAVLLATVTALARPLSTAPPSRQPETFTATAEREGRTVSLTLIVNSYSTDADKKELVAAIKKGSQSELVRVLDSMHRGRLAFHGSVGREINYISARITPQGRTLFMISARFLSFYELSQGERSTQYPLSVIRLTLDRNGHGSGTMIPVARIHLTETNDLRVDPYDQIPVHLLSVRER